MDLKDKLEEVKKQLLARGIRMSVDGCGCCSSPWLAVEIDGEMIVGRVGDDGRVVDVDGGGFNMFEGVGREAEE